jgi:predicted ATPase
LRLARRTHDPVLAVSAHYALGFTWHCLGALTVAHPHLEEAVARYAPDQRHAPVFRMGQDLGVACRVITAATLWLLGYPERALTRLDEALELAHTLAYPYSLVYAHCVASFVYQFRRQVSAVYEQAEAAITLSTKQGFPLWAGVGTIFRGWALALQGQSAAGLAQIRQGIAACRSTGAALQTPYFYSLLADVAVHLGRPEEGLQALSEAQTLMEEHEQRSWEAEIYRLRGVLLLQQPMMPQAEAEIWLQRALDTAHRQEAKSLELRAAMSLARLWQCQGKGAAAHSLLTGIYNWFTEGFDTVDLQAARALLEELAGAGPQQAQERQDHCMPLRLCR